MADIVIFLESVKVFEGLEQTSLSYWHTVISSNLSSLESHFKFVAFLALPLDISQIVSKAIWSLKIKASLVTATGGMNLMLLFLNLVRTFPALSFITVEIGRFLLSPCFPTCIVLEAKELFWYSFWVLDPHFSGTPIYSPISRPFFCLAILGLPDDHPLRLELLTYMSVQLCIKGPYKSIHT